MEFFAGAVGTQSFLSQIVLQCGGGILGLVTRSLSRTPIYMTRFLYIIGLLLTCLVGWALRNWGGGSLPEEFQNCEGDCFGMLATVRVAFALVIYHSVLCIFTLGARTATSFQFKVHNAFWIVKLLMLAGIMAGSFFIDPNRFATYSVVQVFGGGIFNLIVGFILLNISNSVTSYFSKTMEDASGCSKFWAAALLVVLNLGFIGASIYVAVEFDYRPVVPNIILMIISLIASEGLHLLYDQDMYRTGGIIAATMVNFFSTYTSITAIGSRTDLELNTTSWEVFFWVGFVSSVAALVIPLFAPLQGEEEQEGKRWIDFMKTDIEDPDEVPIISTVGLDDDGVRVKYSFAKFHLIFVFAAMYIGCILSNWAIFEYGSFEGDTFALNQGAIPYWIKAVSAWAIQIFFLFSLFASFWWEADIQYQVFS